ncbi:alpha-amylase family glycosyl hydrolase [Xanthomonas campestris]|nr:cyclomaltodextrin glucanotransferase [Xanthomonas campestris pv. campestris]AKS19913.1 cyclomaltodextrin glucanotransferase [Xanthomonas campestris pv. campestris]ALE69180.1 cyclomaltodextrin glucanotransferase [Xanthomonas campestris pv. campestris]PJR25284.1 cyclomaltodextrin glucanotransferase [Xanthomonas campestris pv. campestris]
MMRSVLMAAMLLYSGAACAAPAPGDYYGTLEPFAADAVYFVVTDRFVNGDTGNDHRDQGGAHRSFDVPTPCDGGVGDNIGYLGGDFKGIVDHADYIRGLGFGAVWITPIVDNPDEAFTGGKPITCESTLSDHGKTGYHGYWGVNFYRLDEHLPSPGLDFAGFTRSMHANDLKVVLDIVGNHGSPAYSMPVAQPGFGKLYDAQGRLVADHQNLAPAQLDPAHNPLHAFYNTSGGLAELSDLNEDNPAVLDYLAGAYLQWMEQGADAFRIDTIGWMPDRFWHAFVARIREKRPGVFMFGEAFDYDPAKIAGHTWARNAGVSVLDFPLKQQLSAVFGHKQAGFEQLATPLYLRKGPYGNPYELMSFYDNHDMARLDASDTGFIDAHNWLFTARGIPVIYYGSETGFMRGRAEHAGNRNYFGEERVSNAPQSPIFGPLQRIATLRRNTPALQRGVQVDLQLRGNQAAFLRVYQHAGMTQTALVLLNKGDAAADIAVSRLLQPGSWRDAFSGEQVQVQGRVTLQVPAHGVRVLLSDAPVTDVALRKQLDAQMADQAARDARNK